MKKRLNVDASAMLLRLCLTLGACAVVLIAAIYARARGVFNYTAALSCTPWIDKLRLRVASFLSGASAAKEHGRTVVRRWINRLRW